MPTLPPLMELAPGVTATGALTPDNIEALAAAGTKVIVNNRPDGEDPGQITAEEARQLCAATGARGEETQRFRQGPIQQPGCQQGSNTSEDEHRRPAEVRNQPEGDRPRGSYPDAIADHDAAFDKYS